jgi:hypothetical protein
LFYYKIYKQGKGKVLPRTGHEGPEGGGERYSSTLSLTLALDGVGGQLHAPAALPPGKRPITHCIGDWVLKIILTNEYFHSYNSWYVRRLLLLLLLLLLLFHTFRMLVCTGRHIMTLFTVRFKIIYI